MNQAPIPPVATVGIMPVSVANILASFVMCTDKNHVDRIRCANGEQAP
jgi:hypothetical protein